MPAPHKPAYHMKWIRHHLKVAMSKFTPTGYGHAHKTIMLAKVIERAYEQAERNGITAEELTNALAKRLHAHGTRTQGGGGGPGLGAAVELGLVHGPTTNLKVVSSQLVGGVSLTEAQLKAREEYKAGVAAWDEYFYPSTVKGPTTNYEVVSGQSKVSDEKVEEAIKANPGIYGPICALPMGDPSKWAWVARTPAVEVKPDEMPVIAGPVADVAMHVVSDQDAAQKEVFESLPVVDTPKPAEGPQWPQKASVRVLGPCPNPKVWAAKVHPWCKIGEYDEALHSKERDCSLETNPTRKWRRGEVVEAELIRGGGSPVYRAVL